MAGCRADGVREIGAVAGRAGRLGARTTDERRIRRPAFLIPCQILDGRVDVPDGGLILRARPRRGRQRARPPHVVAAGRLVDRDVHRPPPPARVAGVALAGQRFPLPGDLVEPGRFVVPAAAQVGTPAVHRALRVADGWRRSVTAGSTLSEKGAVAGRGTG